MGSMTYDGMVVHMEDRTLVHLQIVIVNKLRRGESFLMSWRDSTETGDGHSAIWIPRLSYEALRADVERLAQREELTRGDISESLVAVFLRDHLTRIAAQRGVNNDFIREIAGLG